jgi:HTH-type transcriptional regulator / antitoxin HipB
VKYGKAGSKDRGKFEKKAQYFVISEMLKEARKDAKLTQEQLAEKVGTKKSLKCKSGIRLFLLIA